MRQDLRQATTSQRLRQQRQRRQHRRRVLTVILAVVLGLGAVVMAGGYGYAHWRFGQITSIDLPGLTKAPPPGKPQVILVVGSDSRSELNQPGDAQKFGTTQDAGGVRSDVIMLVRLDPPDQEIGSPGQRLRGRVSAAHLGGRPVRARRGWPWACASRPPPPCDRWREGRSTGEEHRQARAPAPGWSVGVGSDEPRRAGHAR